MQSQAPPPSSARWSEGPLGFLLRAWRKRRGLSQLELAKRTGISARHLSFLETGRSRPSKEATSWLATALELPEDEVARLNEAAGFVGGYQTLTEETEASANLRQDIRATLRGLPAPAVVHDRFGTLLEYNAPFAELVRPFAKLDAMGGDGSGHHLLTLLKDHLINWEEVAAFYLRRLEAELVRDEGFDEALATFHKMLKASATPTKATRSAAPPSFCYRIGILDENGESRWYRCTTMTFGAPQDFALRDVRLAVLLPLDRP